MYKSSIMNNYRKLHITVSIFSEMENFINVLSELLSNLCLGAFKVRLSSALLC